MLVIRFQIVAAASSVKNTLEILALLEGSDHTGSDITVVEAVASRDRLLAWRRLPVPFEFLFIARHDQSERL